MNDEIVCPRCHNIFPTTNKLLHDLRCTDKSPVEFNPNGNKVNHSHLMEIKCKYYKRDITINLLYDYNKVKSNWSDELKMIHNDAEENLQYIDIYIDYEKCKFSTEYTSTKIGSIEVIFIFHKLLTNTSFMFFNCSSLESIDLSSFNTTNVTNMSNMFSHCSSLVKKYIF